MLRKISLPTEITADIWQSTKSREKGEMSKIDKWADGATILWWFEIVLNRRNNDARFYSKQNLLPIRKYQKSVEITILDNIISEITHNKME